MMIAPTNSPKADAIAVLGDDLGWRQAAYSCTCIMAISAVALTIIPFPPLNAVCWFGVGFASGLLAKKVICKYGCLQSLTRFVLTVNDRLPYARVIALAIAIIGSFVFPVLAASMALVAGVLTGFSFRPFGNMGKISVTSN